MGTGGSMTFNLWFLDIVNMHPADTNEGTKAMYTEIWHRTFKDKRYSNHPMWDIS